MNAAGDSNDANNFLHKLLLTNAQVLKLRKFFANNSSTNTLGQSGVFLGRLLGPLLNGLSLIGNALKEIAKIILIPIGLAAASATDAATHKKMFGSGKTKLIISNEEMNDVMKIVNSLERSSLLVKGINETVKYDEK